MTTYENDQRTSIEWLPMRPAITCPYCGRHGAVQRRMGVKPFIEHRCPGPFVLAGVEDDDPTRAGYRLTVFPGRYDRDIGAGGDWS